jgi:7,8-dihydro-6-hydroxymethylpterin-pyrophosphokinase
MWERAFVLVPLADLAPDLVPDAPTGPEVRPAGTL